MTEHSLPSRPAGHGARPEPAAHSALAGEQAHLDDLLRRIDDARAELERRLKNVRKEADIDDPQGLMMRDREAMDINHRLESYSAAEIGLMFGRIDVEDEDPENPVPSSPSSTAEGLSLDRRYIGRIGLHDDDESMRTLLMDWRAPMARPFYLATTLHPDGVHTRRHIKTRGRTIVSVADERLMARDGDGPAPAVEDEQATGATVATEAALLDAVTRARSLHMRDIVETIAAEQDTIIRSEHRGVTVVQGAPGTGKTAVALHRAAYLLYTWREILEKSGVLIIGPNDRFLTYISQVLPSLGETGVVLATPGTLLPGITTVAERSLLAREVKGSLEMLTILADAVKTWQSMPDQPRDFTIDGVTVTLTPRMVRAARTRARRSRRPHNQARPLFVEHVVRSLADAMAETIGADPLGGHNLLSERDRAQLREDLGNEAVIVEALEEYWPELTPEAVLERLFAHPEEAAPEYDEQTWAGLRREEKQNTEGTENQATTWTDADAPLLDELADLLGLIDDEEAAAKEREAWLERIAEAQEALDILTGSATQDLDDGFAPEVLMAYDVIDAETLADRQRVRDTRTTAQRAAKDVRWAFGHVIVDEAQELSEMAWRMIFRRSPNRWMTIVGDPAQTGNPAGVETWTQALSPFVADRWQLHQLTVNYRTPADIAALADRLLRWIAPEQAATVSLREHGTGVRVATDVEAAVRQARKLAGDGLVGVIFSDDTTVDPALSDEHTMAAKVSDIKGLEFDEVVLVDPQAIAAASPQGLNDVYVAMTRATQGLTLVVTESQWEQLGSAEEIVDLLV